MSVVSLVGVHKSYGTWPVLQGVDFMVPDGARIGIIGPNGAGKSTMLRIVGGTEDVNEGEVVRRRGVTVSYLEQNPEGDDRTAEAWVLAGRPDIAALDDELRTIEAELARPAVTADLAKMDRVLVKQQAVLDRWVEAGGPGLAGEARSLLVRLGFDDHDLTLPTTALSGGQRKLAAFAACLIRDPDLLLLDEPETHLDSDKREILEDVVAEFPGAVVTVSHDRYLLDDTVNQIAELDRGDGHDVAGHLLRVRRWRRSSRSSASSRVWVTQQKEIARLEAAIARFELWASWVPNERHIRQARNKQRQIDQMDKVDRPVFERRKMALEIRPAERGGQRIARLRDISMSFDDDPVLLDVTFDVYRRERLGVVGPNGAGKTVLGQDPRRRARGDVGRAVGRPLDPDRLPGAGLPGPGPDAHAGRDRPEDEGDVRGRGRRAPREVPVPLRPDAHAGRVALRRGAHAARALPADALGRELSRSSTSRRTTSTSRAWRCWRARWSRSTGPRS